MRTRQPITVEGLISQKIRGQFKSCLIKYNIKPIFLFVEGYTALSLDRETAFGVECFQGDSNVLQKKKWRPIEGGGVMTHAARQSSAKLGVPRRRHRRPTPAVRLETPAGVHGYRGAPVIFRVRVCVKRSQAILLFFIVSRRTSVKPL